MKKLSRTALASLAVVAACSDAPVQPTADAVYGPSSLASVASQADEVAPGEVIVSFKEGADEVGVGRAYGLSLAARGYKNSFVIMKGAAGQERALAAKLAADPAVEYAEPNYIRKVDAIDSRLWAFYNPGGLNMKFNEPGATRDGTFIPSSYASTTDADEDAIEGIGVGFLPEGWARLLSRRGDLRILKTRQALPALTYTFQKRSNDERHLLTAMRAAVLASIDFSKAARLL